MKLAILERDGIIGQPVSGQLSGHHDWRTLPDAGSTIARLNLSGWHVVLVANQPGLGRGLYDCAALNDYHRQMYKELAMVGAKVDAVFFCPHAPEDHCECGAPHATLLRQILERFNMEAARVAVVARSTELLQSAAWVGAWLHWLQPDNAAELPQLQHPATQAATRHSTLAQCAEALLQWQPPRPQPHLAAA